jgi:phosphoribosylformimino-5-aminoimidazole carboxamide ribotide isomerase
MTLVIPAIDIKDGRCVRLLRGSYEHETVYFEDPVKMAKLWRVQNAKVLHVVDLDAARDGTRRNAGAIEAICSCLDIPVQVGGGARSMEDISQLLECGVYRVVIGTAAIKEPELVSEAIRRFGASRIVVGVDALDGEVRVEGWTEGSGMDAVEFALDMETRGCRRVLYTDIDRDGTMEGPNLDAYRELGERLTTCRITASGGVGGYPDLVKIADLAEYRVDSVVIGRALYENRFPCQQFWCWNKPDEVDLDTFSSARLCE